MTKVRQPVSPAYAVKQCMKVVPISMLEEAAGKTDGMIYKYSNPDEPNEISVKDALRLDACVYEAKGASPFRDLFARNLETVSPPLDGCLRDMTLNISAETGQLAAKVLESMSAASAGGKVLTANEAAALLTELEDLQSALNCFLNFVRASLKGV